MVSILNLTILGQINWGTLGFIIVFCSFPFIRFILEKTISYLDNESEDNSEEIADKSLTEDRDIIKPIDENKECREDSRHDDSRQIDCLSEPTRPQQDQVNDI